jgi:hypothetical protein
MLTILRRRILALGLGAVLVPALLATAAGAAVVSVTGSVEVVSPPASVAAGSYESSNIRVWNEQQNVTLSAPVSVDISSSGNYVIGATPLSANTIAAGTCVNVHYVHFDPVATGFQSASGSVRFDDSILGVLVTDAGLASTNGFGVPPTSYLGADSLDNLDVINLNIDVVGVGGPSVIDLTPNLSVGGGTDLTDDLRVITKGCVAPPPVVPEVAFAVLLPVGALALFGGVVLTHRRLALR